MRRLNVRRDLYGGDVGVRECGSQRPEWQTTWGTELGPTHWSHQPVGGPFGEDIQDRRGAAGADRQLREHGVQRMTEVGAAKQVAYRASRTARPTATLG